MKLHDTDDKIETNLLDSTQFTVKASAKAFKILSSNLYSNKIRAIVREVSCNAYDSHVAAGNEDIPFEVHLPSILEPWFSVRDYGVGLSHEEVVNVCTVYFESTKTSSNDYVGALGLGFKSPFSYTNAFTVTAIKDGIKRIYTAFLSETGIPSVTLCSETDTDENNGVEVKLPVESRSIEQWIDESRFVFKWFDKKPKFIGEVHIDIENPFELNDIFGDMDGLHMSAISWNGGNASALQGNVIYPLSVNVISPYLNDVDESLRNIMHGILTNDFVIEFDIGELDTAASREELSYDKTTISNILKRLHIHSLALYEKFNKNTDFSELNQIEIIMALYKMDNGYQYLKNYIDTIDLAHRCGLVSDSFYAERLILKYFKLFNIDKKWIEAFVKKSIYTMYNNFVKVDIHEAKDDLTLENLSVRVYRHYQGRWKQSTSFEISGDSSVCVMVDYADSNIVSYDDILYYLTENGENDTYYVVVKLLKGRNLGIEFVEKKLDFFFNEVMKGFKFRDYIFLSEVKRHSHIKSKKVNVASDGILKFNAFSKTFRVVNTTDFSEDKIYYYVPLRGYSIDSENELLTCDFLSELNRTKIYGIKSYIYGVRKSMISKIEDLDNWVNIEDIINDIISDENALIDFHIAYSVYEIMSRSQLYKNRHVINPYFNFVLQEGGFGESYTKSFEYFMSNKKFDRYIFEPLYNIAKAVLKHKRLVSKIDTSVRKMREKLRKRYPLLINLYFPQDAEVAQINEMTLGYMQMCDSVDK